MRKVYLQPQATVIPMSIATLVCASKVGLSSLSQDNGAALSRGYDDWGDEEDFE